MIYRTQDLGPGGEAGEASGKAGVRAARLASAGGRVINALSRQCDPSHQRSGFVIAMRGVKKIAL